MWSHVVLEPTRFSMVPMRRHLRNLGPRPDATSTIMLMWVAACGKMAAAGFVGFVDSYR